jgi:hypothetical protein
LATPLNDLEHLSGSGLLLQRLPQQSAARHLKISQEATVLRLEQLGLYRAGSYDKWKKLIIRTWSSVIPANTAHQPPSAPPIS